MGAFFLCDICGGIKPRENNRQKRCKKCANVKRKADAKKYMENFYARNPNYDRNYKTWYRKMLKGEDD